MKLNEERIKFIRFLVVGGISAIVQFLVLAFCLRVCRLECMSAASIAYFVSIVVHYILNRYFTFKMLGKPNMYEIMRYLGMTCVNFLITLWITTFFVEKLSLDAYIGTAFSIAATVFISFVAARYWVFAGKKTISSS